MLGLKKFDGQSKYRISQDIPSVCAEKLIKNEADIGLIPVAMIASLPESHIVTSCCIAADGAVDSVVLVSHQPLSEIHEVILDTESRTSVMLARILAREWWQIQPKWVAQKASDDFSDPLHTKAAVMIGDKALRYKSLYPYCYDLAEEWKKFTGLPFVFAAWVSNKEISAEDIRTLELAFKDGLNRRDELLLQLKEEYPGTDLRNYLYEKIRYHLGEKEWQGLRLFLSKCRQDEYRSSGPVPSAEVK